MGDDMHHVGGHRLSKTTIENESDKIEGFLRDGHPELAAQRLSDDAKLIDPESMTALGKALNRKNEDDRQTPGYGNLPDVHLSGPWWEAGNNLFDQNKLSKVDNIKIDGQENINTDEERKHPENAISGNNVIDNPPVAFQAQGDNALESVVTYNAFDRLNPNQYVQGRNGGPLVIRIGNAPLPGNTEYVVPRDQDLTHLPDASQIPARDSNGNITYVWAYPNPRPGEWR